MKKYLWLLVAPLLLTGCFDDGEDVTAPAEDFAQVEENSSDNETTENTETVEGTEVEADSEETETDDGSEEAEGTEETDVESENTQVDNTSEQEETDESENSESASESDDSSETSTTESENTESNQSESVSASQGSTQAQEDAIEAVQEHAELDNENYIYLTHLEENGEWLQVEVREEIADQNHTNLVALFRRHLSTKELEEFDFIEGDYVPAE